MEAWAVHKERKNHWTVRKMKMATITQLIPFISTPRQGQLVNLNFSNKSSILSRCLIHNSDVQTSQTQRLIHHFNPKTPIEEAITPPTSWYTDPSFFHLELDRVFYRGWQVVGQFYSAQRFNLFPLLFLGIFVLLPWPCRGIQRKTNCRCRISIR